MLFLKKSRLSVRSSILNQEKLMLCSFQKNCIPVSKILLGAVLVSSILGMAAFGQEGPTPVPAPVPEPVQPTPSPTGAGAANTTNGIVPSQPVVEMPVQPTDTAPEPLPDETSGQSTLPPQVQTGTPVRGLW